MPSLPGRFAGLPLSRIKSPRSAGDVSGSGFVPAYTSFLNQPLEGKHGFKYEFALYDGSDRRVARLYVVISFSYPPDKLSRDGLRGTIEYQEYVGDQLVASGSRPLNHDDAVMAVRAIDGSEFFGLPLTPKLRYMKFEGRFLMGLQWEPQGATAISRYVNQSGPAAVLAEFLIHVTTQKAVPSK